MKMFGYNITSKIMFASVPIVFCMFLVVADVVHGAKGKSCPPNPSKLFRRSRKVQEVGFMRHFNLISCHFRICFSSLPWYACSFANKTFFLSRGLGKIGWSCSTRRGVVTVKILNGHSNLWGYVLCSCTMVHQINCPGLNMPTPGCSERLGKSGGN